MISNFKLVLDISPFANTVFFLHKELLINLAKNYADYLFFEKSISKEKQHLALKHLVANESDREAYETRILDQASLSNLDQSFLFLSLSDIVIVNKELQELECKKGMLLSSSDEDELLQKINACYSNKIDLILSDFLPDEILLSLPKDIVGWDYFLEKFMFLGPVCDFTPKYKTNCDLETKTILLLFNLQKTNRHAAHELVLVDAFLKSKAFKAINIGEIGSIELLREEISSCASVISIVNDQAIFHQIHTFCKLSGKEHFSWETCPLSPIRFLHSEQGHPHLIEGLDRFKESSLREKINLIIKAKATSAKGIFVEPEKSHRLSSKYYVDKLDKFLSNEKLSGLEETYNSNHNYSESTPFISLQTPPKSHSSFIKWAKGPIAERISIKILEGNLPAELKQNEEFHKVFLNALVKHIFAAATFLNEKGTWPCLFLSKSIDLDGISKSLEESLIELLKLPNFRSENNLYLHKQAVWSDFFIFDLLNPKKRRMHQNFLQLGEKYIDLAIRSGHSGKGDFAWLILFHLYQDKGNKALEILDSQKYGFDDNFIQVLRISAIQVLWSIGDENLAKETIQKYRFSFEVSSASDLLTFSIFAALTDCWEIAKESYELLFKKRPHIFLNETQLKPRNFWLYQALVYKKVGNHELYNSFLRKAEEVDDYWNLQKILIERKILSHKNQKEIIPIFEH